MTKIVYNACYGGFGVSEAGMRRYAEIKGIDLYVEKDKDNSMVTYWTVPPEWNFRFGMLTVSGDAEAYIDTRIPGTPKLHVMGYSAPFSTVDASFDELVSQGLIHVGDPVDGEAVPYVTSYYERRAGFCVSHSQAQYLKGRRVNIVIDTELDDAGRLNYGDVVVPGDVPDEIVFTSYICHPDMVSNELVGPVMVAALYQHVASKPRHYTYRFILAPETIGPLVYLAGHEPNTINALECGLDGGESPAWAMGEPAKETRNRLDWMRDTVYNGYVLTCLGGYGWYSQHGRRMTSPMKRISDWWTNGDWEQFPWKYRMSDERQWCWPGVDLPFQTLQRHRPGLDFPAYHTSRDRLNGTELEADSLQHTYDRLAVLVEIHEMETKRWRATTIGEPFMSRYDLMPTISKVGSSDGARPLLSVLSECDGARLVDIARNLDMPLDAVVRALTLLEAHGLVEGEG